MRGGQGHAIHERGVKHKEAVAKFIEETQKKGAQAEKAQAKLSKELADIERVRRGSGTCRWRPRRSSQARSTRDPTRCVWGPLGHQAAFEQYRNDLIAAGKEAPPMPPELLAPVRKPVEKVEKPKTVWGTPAAAASNNAPQARLTVVMLCVRVKWRPPASTVSKEEKEKLKEQQANVDPTTGLGVWRAVTPPPAPGEGEAAAGSGATGAAAIVDDEEPDDGGDLSIDAAKRFRFKEKQATLPLPDDEEGGDDSGAAFKKRKLDGAKQRSFRKK